MVQMVLADYKIFNAEVLERNILSKMIFVIFQCLTLLEIIVNRIMNNCIFQNKFRGDYSIDQFIDIVVGNRIYMPCLYVFNKIDQISLEEVDRIARTKNSGLKDATKKHPCISRYLETST